MKGMKRNLVEKYADTAYCTLAEADRTVTDMVEAIRRCIVEDGLVDLRGVGRIEAVPVEEKDMMNYITGKMIHVPAHRNA